MLGVSSLPDVPGLSSVPGVLGVSSLPGVLGVSSVPGVLGVSSLPDVPGVSSVPGVLGVSSLPGVLGGSSVPGSSLITGISSVSMSPHAEHWCSFNPVSVAVASFVTLHSPYECSASSPASKVFVPLAPHTQE